MAFGRRERKEDDVIHDAVRVTEPAKPASESAGTTYDAVAVPEVMAPQAVIGQTICIKGEISGDEDLLVEGRIEGTVALPKSRLVIGASGNVAATVKARSLSIDGQIQGDVNAVETVVLTNTARMEGNIRAPRVNLQDGCKFKGTIDMDFEPPAVVTNIKSSAPEPTVKSTAPDQRAS